MVRFRAAMSKSRAHKDSRRIVLGGLATCTVSQCELLQFEMGIGERQRLRLALGSQDDTVARGSHRIEQRLIGRHRPHELEFVWHGGGTWIRGFRLVAAQKFVRLGVRTCSGQLSIEDSDGP